MTVSHKYRCVGVNDEADTCSQCGRTGLRRVAWLVPLLDGAADGEVAPFGTTCAAHLLRGRVGRKPGRRQATRELDAALERCRSEFAVEACSLAVPAHTTSVNEYGVTIVEIDDVGCPVGREDLRPADFDFAVSAARVQWYACRAADLARERGCTGTDFSPYRFRKHVCEAMEARRA